MCLIPCLVGIRPLKTIFDKLTNEKAFYNFVNEWDKQILVFSWNSDMIWFLPLKYQYFKLILLVALILLSFYPVFFTDWQGCLLLHLIWIRLTRSQINYFSQRKLCMTSSFENEHFWVDHCCTLPMETSSSMDIKTCVPYLIYQAYFFVWNWCILYHRIKWRYSRLKGLISGKGTMKMWREAVIGLWLGRGHHRGTSLW